MPKQHWKEAPPTIRHRIEAWQTKVGLLPAQQQLAAMQKAIALGYDYPEVVTPLTDRLKELEAAGDAMAFVTFRRVNLVALQTEERTVLYLQGTRAWAASASHAEENAEHQAKQAAQRRELEIDERTGQLLAAEDAKRREVARKRAEKELAQ